MVNVLCIVLCLVEILDLCVHPIESFGREHNKNSLCMILFIFVGILDLCIHPIGSFGKEYKKNGLYITYSIIYVQ